jgi:hypothetical protein
VAAAIPIAFAALTQWYLGVWGFGYPLDAIGWLVIIMVSFLFWGPVLVLGSRLRQKPIQPPDERVD